MAQYLPCADFWWLSHYCFPTLDQNTGSQCYCLFHQLPYCLVLIFLLAIKMPAMYNSIIIIASTSVMLIPTETCSWISLFARGHVNSHLIFGQKAPCSTIIHKQEQNDSIHCKNCHHGWNESQHSTIGCWNLCSGVSIGFNALWARNKGSSSCCMWKRGMREILVTNFWIVEYHALSISFGMHIMELTRNTSLCEPCSSITHFLLMVELTQAEGYQFSYV